MFDGMMDDMPADEPAASPVAGVSERIAPAAVSAQNEAQNLRYAQQIAEHMAKKFYPEVTQWKPLEGDMFGLITQIDNMITGLMRAKPSAEGDGWIAPEIDWQLLADMSEGELCPEEDGQQEFCNVCKVTRIARELLKFRPAPPSGQGEVR